MKFNATAIAMPKLWLPPKILLVMKMTVLLLIVALTQVSAKVYSQKITASEKNITLNKALKIIGNQSGFQLFYSDQDLKNLHKVDLYLKDASLQDALTACFVNQPLNYKIINNTIVVKRQDPAVALTGKADVQAAIQGRVVDEKGSPLPGVTVRQKNAKGGSLTNKDGYYTINAQKGDVLVFSFIGYKSKEVAVTDQPVLNVSLDPAVDGLEQVVVVGYGTTKRKDLTGAVASVDVNEVKNVPFTTFDQALAGKAAGVQVVQADGSPGGVAKIRIRGGTSILGGNDPLYIIDGVQVTVQNRYIQNAGEVSNPISSRDIAGGSVSDAFARGLNSLGGLNINDIESIDILKDASATAIYGSKAANGVVIITTKKGKYDQKPVLEANYWVGVQDPKKLKLLDADQYKMIMREAAQNLLTEQRRVGRPADNVATNIVNNANYLGNANTDWLALVLRNGITQNADLSVRGGGQNSRYYTSLSYTDVKGVVKGSDMKRVSGKVSLDNNINSRLRTISNIDYGFNTQNITNGAYTQALLAPPTYLPYREDGSVNTFSTESSGAAIAGGLRNPLNLLKGINRGQTASLLGSLALEWDIIKNLKFRSVASINYNQYHQRNYNPGSGLAVNGTTGQYLNDGIAAQGQTESVSQLFENTLTFNKQFNDDNRIDVVAGTSWQKDTQHSFLAQGQYFPDDFVLNDLSSAAVTLPSSSSAGQNSLLSFYARVNYALKDRYLFTFTGRSDASSKFPSAHRTAVFPSGGIAWRISQESFLSKVKWLDDLKLRASAGYTGTQNIGNYLYRTLYSPGTYAGTNAIAPSQLGNNNIKWESTLQKDAGVTFSLFKSRLIGEVGIYEKRTKGLLFGESLAPSAAFGSVIANLASIRNRGLEIDVRGDIIRSKSFTWSGSTNFSFNRSLVTNIDKDFSDPNQSQQYIGNTIIRNGEPIGLFYGSRYLGIIQTAQQLADYKAKYTLSQFISPYLNIGDPMYEINPLGGFPSSELVIGNAAPKFTGGYTNTINFKNLSLVSLFTYAYGGNIYYLADFANQNVNNLSNKQTTILNRWTPQNTDTNRPRIIYTGNTVASLSNANIYSGSYAKLKSVTLSYQLPKSLMNKYKILTASVYASATNLFTITKYPGVDPEVSNDPYSLISGYSDNSGYPTVKTYTIGVRLGF
ncbi:TonB-dependent receptor [Mucilaginibacter sp. CSA2-8R]|uniref:TonB-dependent receptor n=1 Tax=Mucilaginibacter sp. CSA2-8R TaxID=3141542 RepID=UPI00315CC51A